MEAGIFDFVAEALEKRTSLSKLEARGTLRLALKQAGLDPRTVTGAQMVVTLEKVLPKQLDSRGIEGARTVCQAVLGSLRAAHPGSEGGGSADNESPEAIFRRLAQG